MKRRACKMSCLAPPPTRSQTSKSRGPERPGLRQPNVGVRPASGCAVAGSDHLMPTSENHARNLQSHSKKKNAPRLAQGRELREESVATAPDMLEATGHADAKRLIAVADGTGLPRAGRRVAPPASGAAPVGFRHRCPCAQRPDPALQVRRQAADRPAFRPGPHRRPHLRRPDGAPDRPRIVPGAQGRTRFDLRIERRLTPALAFGAAVRRRKSGRHAHSLTEIRRSPRAAAMPPALPTYSRSGTAFLKPKSRLPWESSPPAPSAPFPGRPARPAAG